MFNNDMMRSLMENMDEEQARALLNDIDLSKVIEGLIPLLNDELQPHFDDIRERAQQADTGDTARFYENLGEDAQQEAFDKTMADLIAVLRECRENPKTGFPKLKSRLRDPDVYEPLLLIFHNENNINPQYTQQMKEYSRVMMTWAGASVLPEMYSDEERENIERELAGP